MKQGTNTRRSTVAVLVLVLAAIALAIYVIRAIDLSPRTDDAYVYADTVDVAPEVSGRIVKLAVTDNQRVRAGDLLFQIDPAPFEATLARAEASLKALDSEIELTQRSVNAQQFAAAAGTAEVARARAAAGQAADTLARIEPLQGKEYVSAEQVDQARTAKRVAQAGLDAALQEARRAQAAVSGVDALVARRDVVKAEIVLARLHLDYTQVRAPCDGLVISLKNSAGQYASAGRPVFTLANTARWYVVANFRETDLANIRAGRSAQVYLLSDTSRRYRGTVESVGYGVFPDDGGAEAGGLPRVPRSINWVRVAQRFPVRILIEKPDASFRIGASAVAIMTSDDRSQPKAAGR
jgi:multidrug efflux system membrane fusion protein